MVATSELGSVTSWLVLAIVSLNAGLNSYLYPVGSKLQWIFHFWVVLGMTPGTFVAVKYERLALSFSVFVNLTSIWLRWICVHSHVFKLCSVSMLINAAATWTILALPAQISQGRFRKDQRALTTSIALQASYLGLLLSVVLPPQFRGAEKFVPFCLWQAIIMSPLVVLMLVCYRQQGSAGRQELSESVSGEDIEGGHDMVDDASFCKLFRTCYRHPMYFFQVLACGLLGAVSLVQPTTAVFILRSNGFENDVAIWLNLASIGVGVISGLVVGKLCVNAAKFGLVLKCSFLGCTVCNALCAVLAGTGFVNPYVITILSAGIGMTSQGVIGVAIEHATSYPVGAGYACWFVMLVVYGGAGGLGLWVFEDEQGFTKLTSVTAVATLLIFACQREPPRKSASTAA